MRVERDGDLVGAAAERAVEVGVEVGVPRGQRRRFAPGQTPLRIGSGVEAAHRLAHHAAELEERRRHLLGQAFARSCRTPRALRRARARDSPRAGRLPRVIRASRPWRIDIMKWGKLCAMRLTTPAIVLRTVDYGEADRVVTLFTRDAGKLSALARGARKSVQALRRGARPVRRRRGAARRQAERRAVERSSVSTARAAFPRS